MLGRVSPDRLKGLTMPQLVSLRDQLRTERRQASLAIWNEAADITTADLASVSREIRERSRRRR